MSDAVQEAPLNADPTVRLVFCALVDLYDGHDLVIVACPAEEARRIAATVIAIAKKMDVKCANRNDGDGSGPKVTFRTFDGEIPVPTPKARAHIDHSATFERQHVLPPAHRSVVV